MRLEGMESGIGGGFGNPAREPVNNGPIVSLDVFERGETSELANKPLEIRPTLTVHVDPALPRSPDQPLDLWTHPWTHPCTTCPEPSLDLA